MKLKLNRKREKRKRGEERNEIRKRKRERGREKREKGKTSSPTTDGETNVTTHPVAPANYIMIFNGPKSKTWPSKIFGRGVG